MYVWSFTARCLDDACHQGREHFRVLEEGVGEDHPITPFLRYLVNISPPVSDVFYGM